MVGQAGGKSERKPPLPARSPRSVGGTNTQMLAIFVDDADAHCARARAAGGKIHDEPTTTDYGDDYWADRTYRVEDPEGHHWWFMQRSRTRGPCPRPDARRAGRPDAAGHRRAPPEETSATQRGGRGAVHEPSGADPPPRGASPRRAPRP